MKTMTNRQARVFDHVLIIVLENEYRSYVMKNPYMAALAEQGIELVNHFGNMHPSQTNYVSTVAGELCNITYDWPPYPPVLPQRTLVDLLEESPLGLRWKAYLQSYVKTLWKPDLDPSDFPVPFPVPEQLWETCPPPFRDVPQPLYPYAYFHNPFCLFERVLRDPKRWKKLEDEAAFWRDLLVGDFPEFAWFSPNLWDDGHYLYGTCIEPEDRAPLVDQQARWLQSFFESLQFPGPKSRLPPRTLVVVTYDEADYDLDYDAHQKSSYDGPNQIYTVLLGDIIKPERRMETSNHYSLLKTVEKNFGLGSLEKNDRDASWWQFLWGKEFAWYPAAETPVTAQGAAAAAGLGSALYVVHVGAANALKFSVFDGERWSAEKPVGSASGSEVALAAQEHGLILVYKNGDELAAIDYSPSTGWSDTPKTLVAGPVGAFSVASLEFNRSTMLAYATPDGGIHSMLFAKGQWAPAVDVGHATDGALILATLGPSLFLIHKAVASDEMQVVSYNTADFNVVTGPEGKSTNNTTKDMWSPSQFPVAYFWRGPAPSTPGELEPLRMPYRAGPCLAAATLDGVIHLTHPRVNNPQVMTETFAQSGIMTPANPVSWITAAQAAARALDAGLPPHWRYSIWSRFLNPVEASLVKEAEEKKATSNGFGTLAQAGWSLQEPIHDVRVAGALTMTRFGNRLALLSQPKPGGNLHLSIGEYVNYR
jgi:hypothetical protein